MPGYDPLLLKSMGIEETSYDFPLPTYTTKQMVSHTQNNGLTVYHSQPRPLAEVAMIRLIFQIVDYQRFIR
jgi:hypothetical protein